MTLLQKLQRLQRSLAVLLCGAEQTIAGSFLLESGNRHLPAQLNLTICKALTGDADEAEFRLNKMVKVFGSDKNIGQKDIAYTSAIIDFIKGNKKVAIEKFNMLATSGNPFAKKTIVSLDPNAGFQTLENSSSCFDSLRNYFPVSPFQKGNNRKTNFSGPDGIVSIYKLDSLSMMIYYFDFKGPGGFRRILTLYKLDVNSPLLNGIFNTNAQGLTFKNICGLPALTFPYGNNPVNYFSGRELNLCLFENDNIPVKAIVIKK